MSDKNNIDKFFKEKIQNFEKLPPPEILDNILTEVQPERKLILPVVWRIAAGIAIIVGLGFGFNFLSKMGEDQLNQFSENETLTIEEEKSPESETSGIDVREEAFISGIVADSQKISDNVVKETSNLIEPEPSDKEDRVFEIVKKNNPPEEDAIISSTNYLVSMPKQIKASPARKDSIPIKKFKAQYTWNDLHAFIEPQEEDKEGKFLVSALMSPVYSYRDIVNSTESVSWFYNDSERGKISYSGGMKIGYKASKRLSIHTGLVYSRLGYTIEGITTVASIAETEFVAAYDVPGRAQPLTIPNSIGTINTDNLNSNSISTSDASKNQDASLDYFSSGALLDPTNRDPMTDVSLNQIFHMMEIPFLLRYKLVDRKMDFNLLGGLSTNFLIGNSLILKEGSEKTDVGETGSLNTVNYSGNIGLGFEYDITKNLLLQLEPQFKYYLNSINKDFLISTRPYSFGFYTGVSLKF